MSLYDNKFMDYYNFLFTDLAGKREYTDCSQEMRFKSLNQYYWLFKDPRTNHWPTISSPVPGLTILGFYLYFVLSWGPKYMAHRKPYKLESILIVYNFIQVIVSLYIFFEVN